MARDRAEVLRDLKIGEAIEISSFLGGVSREKVVATVTDIQPGKVIFDASLFGVHVGVLEWREGDKEPFYMEPPK